VLSWGAAGHSSPQKAPSATYPFKKEKNREKQERGRNRQFRHADVRYVAVIPALHDPEHHFASALRPAMIPASVASAAE